MGGTIAMTSSGGGGVRPSLSVEDLVAAVPGLQATGIAVETASVRQLPGASLDFDDVEALSAEVDERLADGVHGVVVTQGTDTIEETAYLLDLLREDDRPVVVTGAMRSPAHAGADGPANVLAAVQVAASDLTRGLGVLVVFADEIHAAARVRKAHSTSTHAFVSPTGGPLGHVVEGEPWVVSRPARRCGLPAADGAGRRIEVGLITVVLGDTGVLLDGVDDRLDGLVVAGFGVGHVPQGLVDRLERLAARIPVVLVSRTGAGPVLTRTYGFPGSESDLLRRGLIPAGPLDPLKARILLTHLLRQGFAPDRIRALFVELSAPELRGNLRVSGPARADA